MNRHLFQRLILTTAPHLLGEINNVTSMWFQ